MTPDPQPIRIRHSEDLLALVPYLCGYHPDDGSLVIVGFRGRRCTYAACGDLPEAGAGAEAAARLAAQVTDRIAGRDADLVAVVGYGPAARVDPVAAAAPAALAARGIRLVDVLRVTSGRWWSYQCSDPGCCPLAGQRFDPRSHPLAAAATVAGLVAYPDRAALAAQLAPVTGLARQVMHQATRAARGRLAHELAQHPLGAQAAWRRRQGHAALRAAFATAERGQPLSDEQAAWLCLLLADPAVRDLAWVRTGRDPAHLRLWVDLTRRAEPELVAAPASLCAFAAWYGGDGALARVAVQQALQADRTYRMALLVQQALDAGISPEQLGDWQALAAAWLHTAPEGTDAHGGGADLTDGGAMGSSLASSHDTMAGSHERWWTCPGCGVTVDATGADLIIEHVRGCDRVDGAGRPVPGGPS